MNRKTIIIFVFILASCSSNKVISNYLSDEIINQNKSTIFVNKNIISNLNVLNILKTGIGRNDTIKPEKLYKGSKEFNNEDLMFLTNKFKNDTIIKNWKVSDFESSNIQIIENSLDFLKNNRDKIDPAFYAFSNEIHYKDKTLFYVSKSFLIGRVQFSGVLVLKKIDNKWTIIETIESSDLY